MEMPLKPQVLHDLAADINLSAAIPLNVWRDPSRDIIQLEDESGRLTIVGHKLMEHTLCTGIIVAVLGSETSSGEFDVIDVLYPGESWPALTASEKPLSTSDQSSSEALVESEQDNYVIAVSGLALSNTDGSTLALDMLADYLTGELTDPLTHRKISRISSLVILGDSISAAPIVEDDAMSRKLAKNKKYGYDSATFNARPIEILDEFLANLCQSIDVVLMPGSQDPTNITLPQKPLNKIMLRTSAQYAGHTLDLATNPTYLQMAERKMFCTAGQTIEDLRHYISTKVTEAESQEHAGTAAAMEALDLAEETLKWGHFAPTAPDTLWTYPYADEDPFIADPVPDVYLVGNQYCYAERLVQFNRQATSSNCKIILIPSFSTTHEAVLINLSTLKSEVLRFTVN